MSLTAGRLRGAVGGSTVVITSLLAVVLFSGCGYHREFYRQGVVLDSLAVRNDRVERQLAQQDEYVRKLRAELLTEMERFEGELGMMDARLVDLNERLARIGRKLGVWHTAVVAPADSADSTFVPPDTVVVPPDTVRSGVDPDQLYNTAYLDFTRGKYNVAIAGLEQFLKMFPDSDMSDNAQYWIGESWYSEGDLTRAEQEFKKVLIRYPTGNKVPAASYKLGLVYQTQGRLDAARRQFESVIEKYPGTTEAKLAQERLSR